MSDKNNTQTPTTESTDEVVVEPTRLQKFVNNHPRASRAIAIVGAVATVAGTVTIATTMQKNKHHLNNAADQAQGALSELSNAVSPTSETDA